MATTLVKHAFRLAPVFIVVLVVVGAGTPAFAQARCAQTLRECYGRAATRQSVWEMWAAGVDCELDFVECARRVVVGK